jgi:hypothetical protein
MVPPPNWGLSLKTSDEQIQLRITSNMKKLFIILFTAIIMLLIPGCKESSEDTFVGSPTPPSYIEELMRSRIDAWRLIEIKDDYNSSCYFNEYAAAVTLMNTLQLLH